jgi:hypothetical protein
MGKEKKNWRSLIVRNSVLFLVVITVVSVSACQAEENIVEHKVGGINVVFNGETVDGMTASCDLTPEIRDQDSRNLPTESYRINNYEFLGYFYVDLHNMIATDYSMEGVNTPHFYPGGINCRTYGNQSGIGMYFFFNKDLSDEEIRGILHDVKSDLEGKWYAKSVRILSKIVLFGDGQGSSNE